MMHSRDVRRATLPATLAALVGGALLSAQGPVLESAWRVREIVIDGQVGDWERLQRVGDGPAVAIDNDQTSLRVAVATNDEVVRRQLATGLVVWIDADGRRRQSFGLRLEGLVRRPLPGATPGATAATLPPGGTSSTVLDQVDVLGPGRGQRRLIEDPASVGIRAAVGTEGGAIGFEIEIPLERTPAAPHAVGARPGSTISVGLETPPDPKTPRERGPLDSSYPYIYDPYWMFFNPPPPTNAQNRPPKEVVIKPLKLLWAGARLASPPR